MEIPSPHEMRPERPGHPDRSLVQRCGLPASTCLPGTRVGSRRWPGESGHPDSWGLPHLGVVLPRNDPRAWAGTIAFSGMPSIEQVDAHLKRVACSLDGLGIPSNDDVPVLWDFGKVFFVKPESLRLAQADIDDWRRARAEAKAQLLKTSKVLPAALAA